MVILCATVIVAVALLCMVTARMARKQQRPEETSSLDVSVTISVSGQTESSPLSSEHGDTGPDVSSQHSDSPPVSSMDAHTSESGSFPLIVEEVPPVRRIENFLLYPSDSDEYRLAWLLLEEVPTVRILIQAPVKASAPQAPAVQTAAAAETTKEETTANDAIPIESTTGQTTAENTASAETEATQSTAEDTTSAETEAAQSTAEDTASAETEAAQPTAEDTTSAKTEAAQSTAKDTASAETEATQSAVKNTTSAKIEADTDIPARYMDAKGSVSLYYKDLTDGETLVFNPDKIQYAASMIKIVYVYALLSAADEGRANLDQTVVYDAAKMYRTGSGNFASVPDGTSFSVWELIERTVVSSDNTAYGMLQGLYGYRLFTSAMEAAGLPSVYRDWWRTPVEQYGQFFETLHAYLTSGGENGARLCGLMCRSTQTVMLKNALKPEKVAHKYGWDVGSYCDGAVVLNEEHPYIVIFMSNLDEGHVKRANTEFIYEVGGLVKRIHDKKYENAAKEEQTDAETLPL